MSTEPKKEDSDKKNTEDVEIKIVPEGTFGGTIDKPMIVKEGEPVPEDLRPVDADNHYYEATDAFIRHLPKGREKLVQWATIDGKPRMIVDNKVFRFIPNPTFDPVARPGCLHTAHVCRLRNGGGGGRTGVA